MSLFSKVQTFSFKNIDSFLTASLSTRLTNDITLIQNTVTMGLRLLVRAPLMLIFAIFMVVRLNSSLAVILAIISPILIIALAIIIFNAMPRFGIMQKRIDKLNSNVQENLTNVRVVKSFVREEFEKEKATVFSSIITVIGIFFLLITRNWILTIRTFLTAPLMILAARKIMQMSVGSLVVFLQLTQQFGIPINEASNQYNTIITAIAGANLSQGQRQLLNIARAAVADAPILILDEATSSVDTRTELHIEHGLDRLMENRTTFVIAHKLSTVRNSNAIMVMDQ